MLITAKKQYIKKECFFMKNIKWIFAIMLLVSVCTLTYGQRNNNSTAIDSENISLVYIDPNALFIDGERVRSIRKTNVFQIIPGERSVVVRIGATTGRNTFVFETGRYYRLRLLTDGSTELIDLTERIQAGGGGDLYYEFINAERNLGITRLSSSEIRNIRATTPRKGINRGVHNFNSNNSNYSTIRINAPKEGYINIIKFAIIPSHTP
jgi:hypothetical protein